jgi:hypothetical protein
MLPVTSKFRGFKLDHFTRFYLKLAGKTAVFSPKLHGFFVCLFVCYYASRRDAYPISTGYRASARFGPESTRGFYKPRVTDCRYPHHSAHGTISPCDLPDSSSSLSHYMQGQCLTRPSWGVKHWINFSRCDTTSVKCFDIFFIKLQFSSKNRHFPLNFFFNLRKTSRRFPGPVGPCRSQFGGLLLQDSRDIFFVVYIDF